MVLKRSLDEVGVLMWGIIEYFLFCLCDIYHIFAKWKKKNIVLKFTSL